MLKAEQERIQNQLRVAVMSHQMLVAKLKSDSQNKDLETQLHELQSQIRVLNEKQKLLVDQMNQDQSDGATSSTVESCSSMAAGNAANVDIVKKGGEREGCAVINKIEECMWEGGVTDLSIKPGAVIDEDEEESSSQNMTIGSTNHTSACVEDVSDITASVLCTSVATSCDVKPSVVLPQHISALVSGQASVIGQVSALDQASRLGPASVAGQISMIGQASMNTSQKPHGTNVSDMKCLSSEATMNLIKSLVSSSPLNLSSLSQHGATPAHSTSALIQTMLSAATQAVKQANSPAVTQPDTPVMVNPVMSRIGLAGQNPVLLALNTQPAGSSPVRYPQPITVTPVTSNTLIRSQTPATALLQTLPLRMLESTGTVVTPAVSGVKSTLDDSGSTESVKQSTGLVTQALLSNVGPLTQAILNSPGTLSQTMLATLIRNITALGKNAPPAAASSAASSAVVGRVVNSIATSSPLIGQAMMAAHGPALVSSSAIPAAAAAGVMPSSAMGCASAVSQTVVSAATAAAKVTTACQKKPGGVTAHKPEKKVKEMNPEEREMQNKRSERKRKSTANPHMFVYGGHSSCLPEMSNAGSSCSSSASTSSCASADRLNESYSCYDESICVVCEVEGGEVIMCDSCAHVYHMYCLTPPLTDVPSSLWSCPECVALQQEAGKQTIGLTEASTLNTTKDLIGQMYANLKAIKEEEKNKWKKRREEISSERIELEIKIKEISQKLIEKMNENRELVQKKKNADETFKKLSKFICHFSDVPDVKAK